MRQYKKEVQLSPKVERTWMSQSGTNCSKSAGTPIDNVRHSKNTLVIKHELSNVELRGWCMILSLIDMTLRTGL